MTCNISFLSLVSFLTCKRQTKLDSGKRVEHDPTTCYNSLIVRGFNKKNTFQSFESYKTCRKMLEIQQKELLLAMPSNLLKLHHTSHN